MLPPLKPEHVGKNVRADFLDKIFPDQLDPKSQIPKPNPKGVLGIESEELNQKAYEKYGPPKVKERVDRELMTATNKVEIFQQLDARYYEDLTEKSNVQPVVVTYD